MEELNQETQVSSRKKGGLVTMPFIIGMLILLNSHPHSSNLEKFAFLLHMPCIFISNQERSGFSMILINLGSFSCFAANEAFEKVASYGLVPNMIFYLMTDYKISVAKGTNILFLWTAASNFAPVLGAFLSDSYLGRFLTIGLGSTFSFLQSFKLFKSEFLVRT